jgi:ArsR family transcriptional regulator
MLRTISESSRLKIICLLGSKELCVCELMEALKLPHNLMSHHLKSLTRAGLISMRKVGRFRFYKIKRKNVQALTDRFICLLNNKGGH